MVNDQNNLMKAENLNKPTSKDLKQKDFKVYMEEQMPECGKHNIKNCRGIYFVYINSCALIHMVLFF